MMLLTAPVPVPEAPPGVSEPLWWAGVGLLTIGATALAAAGTVLWLSNRGRIDPYYDRPVLATAGVAVLAMVGGVAAVLLGETPALPSGVHRSLSVARWVATIAGLVLVAGGLLLVRRGDHGFAHPSLGWRVVATGSLLIVLTLVLEAVK